MTSTAHKPQETPRTDLVWRENGAEKATDHRYLESRQLETELTAALAENERLMQANEHWHIRVTQEKELREQAEQSLAQARACINALSVCSIEVVDEWRDSIDDDSIFPSDHPTKLLEDALKKHAAAIQAAQEGEKK